MFEARILFGSPSTPGGVVPHPSRPLVTLPIMVGLTAVTDLTDPTEAATLDTNAQESTGDSRSYATRIPPSDPPAPHTGVPPTHNLGNALFALGKHQGLPVIIYNTPFTMTGERCKSNAFQPEQISECRQLKPSATTSASRKSLP
jgi:hypothetical protein